MANDYKNIVKLSKSFWTRIGQLAIQWIRADAKQGIMQTPDGNSNKPNYNKDYAKYKANDMRRLTTSSGQKAKSPIQGGTKKTFGSGQRLKAYYSETISNRDVSKVNMELTNKMFKGLHIVTSDNYSVTCGYRSEDAMKVIGNKDKYNRDVANLNNKNREKVKQLLLNQFKENIRKELKDITINVRFG